MPSRATRGRRSREPASRGSATRSHEDERRHRQQCLRDAQQHRRTTEPASQPAPAESSGESEHNKLTAQAQQTPTLAAVPIRRAERAQSPARRRAQGSHERGHSGESEVGHEPAHGTRARAAEHETEAAQRGQRPGRRRDGPRPPTGSRQGVRASERRNGPTAEHAERNRAPSRAPAEPTQTAGMTTEANGEQNRARQHKQSDCHGESDDRVSGEHRASSPRKQSRPGDGCTTGEQSAAPAPEPSETEIGHEPAQREREAAAEGQSATKRKPAAARAARTQPSGESPQESTREFERASERRKQGRRPDGRARRASDCRAKGTSRQPAGHQQPRRTAAPTDDRPAAPAECTSRASSQLKPSRRQHILHESETD